MMPLDFEGAFKSLFWIGVAAGIAIAAAVAGAAGLVYLALH
jgi:hypothetical protein